MSSPPVSQIVLTVLKQQAMLRLINTRAMGGAFPAVQFRMLKTMNTGRPKMCRLNNGVRLISFFLM
jgi:hypothetical protein